MTTRHNDPTGETPPLLPSTPHVEKWSGDYLNWHFVRRDDWPAEMDEAIRTAALRPGTTIQWTAPDRTLYRVTWSVGPSAAPPALPSGPPEKSRGSAEGPLPAGALDYEGDEDDPGPNVLVEKWVWKGPLMADGKGPRWVYVDPPYKGTPYPDCVMKVIAANPTAREIELTDDTTQYRITNLSTSPPRTLPREKLAVDPALQRRADSTISISDARLLLVSAVLPVLIGERKGRSIGEDDAYTWAAREAIRYTAAALNELAKNVVSALSELAKNQVSPPIDVVLPCPVCGANHIDAPEPENGWTNPPHRSHVCAYCKCVWRPADVATNGVEAVKTRGKLDNYPPAPTPPAAEDPKTH